MRIYVNKDTIERMKDGPGVASVIADNGCDSSSGTFQTGDGSRQGDACSAAPILLWVRRYFKAELILAENSK